MPMGVSMVSTSRAACLSASSGRLTASPVCCSARPRRAALAVCASHAREVSTSAVATAVEAPTTTIAAPHHHASTGHRVTELDPGSFHDFIRESDSLVVVDWYTDWCGPCQLMHKEVEKLSSAFKNVQFAKLNCSDTTEFATRQRIRALPTFRIYHKGACLDEVTGAKPVQLRQLLTHYSVMTSIHRQQA